MSQADTIKDQVEATASIDSTLADLGALYEPPSVEFAFETIGWTYLLWACLIACVAIIFLLARKYIKNRYRREALAALKGVESGSATMVFVVLKRTAMQVFGREETGSLYGAEWLDFLERTGKGVQFKQFQSDIANEIYKNEPVAPETMDAILLNAQKWIRSHAG